MLPNLHNLFVFYRALIRAPQRWPATVFLLAGSLVLILLALINAFCLLLDRLLFPGLSKVTITRPIFIYGIARSGTTLLEYLLFPHCDQLTYQKVYAMLFPSILQRKGIGLIRAMDRRYLKHRIYRFFKRLETRSRAETQKIHPTSLFAPGEDEGMFNALFASPVLPLGCLPMPALDNAFARFPALSPAQQQRMLRHYRACLKRHLYCNGPHRRYCSKHVALLRKITTLGLIESGHLWQQFPDATLIYIVRDPLKTIPGAMNLVRTAWQRSQLQNTEDWAPLYQNIFEELCHACEWAAQMHLRHWDGGDVKVVSYRDLKHDPLATCLAIYAHLGIPAQHIDREHLENACRQSHDYVPAAYTAEEFGFTEEQILARTQRFRQVFAEHLSSNRLESAA